jgi:benzoyl-CoA reductase/2-hydroxyglutaryl-CoA dehydratase subunit BcrC/BadD/HgdB
MIELLKLVGYETQEIEAELPRVEKAFKKIGITTEDVARGKKRLKKYYDIELQGVRKVFRLCVGELVDSLLLKEDGKKKIIYGFMAPGVDIFGSALVSKSKEIFSIHHCWAFHIVVGCIFGKMVPFLETAEKKWLKSGVVAHCANVKTLLGPMALNLFPKPDLLITAGYLCETSSKTLDLLEELYQIPVHCVDTCQDREIGDYPEGTTRITTLAVKSLKRLAERLQMITGVEITDDMLWEVLNAKGDLDAALSKVRNLVSEADPLLLSSTHENIWMCLMTLTQDIEGFSKATDAINTLYEELQERAKKGAGVVEKGAPRILAMLPAGQTDPRLEHLACEVGLAIVAQDTALRVPDEGKPKDPYEVIAGDILKASLLTTLPRRIPLIVDGCKRLKVDGVLNRFHAGCRSVTGDAIIIEKAIKEELGIPVLTLEWENFDPRAYDHEQFKQRLEVFKTMMQ